MARLFRWLIRIFTGLLLLSLAVTLLAYYFAIRSIPDYDADYSVAGVQGAIEIVRDNHNVPHVFAENDLDVYYGLGFAHAQDRLWQMTMLRRTAQGRLSELFGEKTLRIDDLIRRLDLYGLSQKSFKYQATDVQHALEAYAMGVNAWLGVVQSEALGRGAPEFFLFSPEIAPWTPTDSLAILRVMALQLSDHLRREVTRAQLSLALDPDRLRDILPDAPGAAVTALPEFSQIFPDIPAPTELALNATNPFDPVKPLGVAGASNAWAAMASRTTRNAPLLATDPHLGLSAPGIWMLARLEFSDGGVIGGTIPGIPSILIGRSEGFGWGVTSAYMDDVDIYIEKLNPDNPKEYLTPEGYKPFRTQEVLINIKDTGPETHILRWTENGPVIPGVNYDLASITPPGHVVSIAWTALDADDQSMTASLRLMRAKSIAQGRAAGQLASGPSQNITMADQQSIALQTIGKMPRRALDHTSQGRIPAPGWLPQNRWQGYMPYEDNPYVSDPASGIVANTNNKTTDAPYPAHVSHSWGDTQRIKRITGLLNSRQVHSRESFIEAQLDPVSITARTLLPLIASELWYQDTPADPGTPEHQRQVALALLADWNGEMNEHLPEPLVYAAWLRNLQKKLSSDELGPLITRLPRPDPVFVERVYRDIDGASAWCDVKQSAAIETCVDTARLALDQAIDELTQLYGPRIDSWRWGQAHQAHHDHAVLGKIPLLSWFTNIRQDTSGGDNTLLRGRSSGEGETPYANIHAAGFRAVYDFADPESSLYITATGQSGHFLSRHYDDLSQLWRRGEYIPMTLDPSLARGGAVGTTRLIPTQP